MRALHRITGSTSMIFGNRTRSRRRVLTAAFALIVGVASSMPALAQSLTLEALMQELARGSESSVTYRETKHSALLKTPLETTGELRYRRPAFLERRVKTPQEERYTIDGDTLTIERKRDGQSRTVGLQSQPVLWALVEGIRATLRGDAATLQRFYRLELEGDVAAWTLHLLPSGTDMAEFVRVVRINGGKGRLRGMEIVEASGDRTVTVFSEGVR
jgi:outer membrane lipoprotein-sorting protein